MTFDMSTADGQSAHYHEIRQRLYGGRTIEVRPRMLPMAPVERKPAVAPPAPPQPTITDRIEVVDALDEDIRTINGRWKSIVREVCTKHGVSINDIRSHIRSRPVVAARHEAMYRLRTETGLSLPEIGRRMGGFDHSSTLYAVSKYREILEKYGIEP
jgi:hypothetical protein